jgi:hypothetical protein
MDVPCPTLPRGSAWRTSRRADKYKDADISAWKEGLTQAHALFQELGCESEDISRRMEAFLCISSSGLLFLCLDKAFKAIEDWDVQKSRGIVACASEFLKKKEYLEGATSVTPSNRQRCRALIQFEMPKDRRFEEGYASDDVDEEELLQKWEAYLELGCDCSKYFAQYYVRHTILKFATPLVKEVEEDSIYAVGNTLESIILAFKDLRSEYEPGSDNEDVDGYDSSGMNNSD